MIQFTLKAFLLMGLSASPLIAVSADNDHVFRHRAPLFLARVDAERLCVLRETEKVLIPERGAAMGNFGAAAINENESWVTVAEYLGSGRPLLRGANGSTFVARVIWSGSD